MDCRQVRKSLLEYSRGDRHVGRREEIERHLETCDGCALIAEKLELSSAALSGLEPVRMSDAAAERVFYKVKKRAGAARSPGAGVSLLRSPRALAGAAAVVGVMVALAVVVGIYTGGDTSRDTQTRQAETAETTADEAASKTGTTIPASVASGALPLPIAAATANDYDQESMRTMAEKLEVSEKFASSFSLSDAVNLKISFIRKLADDFVDVGGDGAMLEAMMTFVQTTEPVLLPCYVEKAHFTGREVYIIAFSAPPRSGTSTRLTRTEFWAFDPVTFSQDPEASLLWWGQSSD
jgi:hypothetical protein